MEIKKGNIISVRKEDGTYIHKQPLYINGAVKPVFVFVLLPNTK